MDPEIWQHAIVKPKWLICPIWGFFFPETTNVRFMYPLALFIVQNYKKNLSSLARIMRTGHFPAQNSHVFLQEFFSGAFHCAKSQKNPKVDPKLLGCAIFRTKMTCLPGKRIFSENRIVLIEISLVDSIFGHNLSTRFFPHMRFSQNVKGW